MSKGLMHPSELVLLLEDLYSLGKFTIPIYANDDSFKDQQNESYRIQLNPEYFRKML